MRPDIVSTLVLAVVAVILAYLRDPGLPALGIKNGASMLWFPMVSVPFMVALAQSGAAMGPLVAYRTSWSLFGMQRIIAWEAPLMGWRFVVMRVVPSLAFPVLAGWLVKVFYQE